MAAAVQGILRRSTMSLTWCTRQNFARHGNPVFKRLASKNIVKASEDVKYKDLPTVHVNATFNNTLLTVADGKGNTLAWASAGTEGYKNSRRGSSLAGQQAGTAAAKKATALGIKKVKVKVKGVGSGRQSSLKGLETGGLRVVSITDVTPIPHNGCRPRKARRL